MSDGQGCKCAARCEGECCCDDVDWRSAKEVAQAERIRELEAENDPQALTIAYMSGAADARRKYDELAAQNQVMREALEYQLQPLCKCVAGCPDCEDKPGDLAVARKALALPDLAPSITNEIRAQALEEASERMDDDYTAGQLWKMAQELRSNNG